MAVVIWGTYRPDLRPLEGSVVTALFTPCPEQARLLELMLVDPSWARASALQETYDFKASWRCHWLGPVERQTPPSSSGGS